MDTKIRYVYLSIFLIGLMHYCANQRLAKAYVSNHAEPITILNAIFSIKINNLQILKSKDGCTTVLMKKLPNGLVNRSIQQ